MIFILSRYILPPSVTIDHSLSTLADHLKQSIKTNDFPIIMYLHGQAGTRYIEYRILKQIH